jgi:muramoyltetrapeptide carboxypeptidase
VTELLRSLARPRALRPGDRLAVLCVSGPVDPEPLAAGLDALRFAGLEPVTIVPGKARGVTVGGTLSLLVSSLGTGTSRPARGGILLLEDVGEEPYRIDRMLTQLRRSGYLDGVAGIVTGTFHDCGPPELIQDILAERLGPLAVPMLAWANVGHGGPFQTFPLGIAAELDAGRAALGLLDPPLS